MKIYVTRDSVCAGDDVDAPHARELVVKEGLSVEELVLRVVEELPSISGGKATWCVSSNVPLAVVAQEWKEVRFVRLIPPRMGELDVVGGAARFHISYFAQQEPERVLEILGRLRLRAK